MRTSINNFRFSGILALVAAACAALFLAGCGPGGPPKFSGATGHLDHENGFLDFLDQNAGHLVQLDVSIPNAEFEGGEEAAFAFFVLFETCSEELTKDEKPSVANCQGTEIHVPKAAVKREGNTWRLRGQFEPSEPTGPLQGMLAINLRPAP